MYDWINENHVKTLNKITHVHFDFMTPKCHKITPRDKKKECVRERERAARKRR